MTPHLTLVTGPHLLFVGGNGHRTFGITVRAQNPQPGRKAEWNINDYSIAQTDLAEALGIAPSEWKAIQDRVATLAEEQTSRA